MDIILGTFRKLYYVNTYFKNAGEKLSFDMTGVTRVLPGQRYIRTGH